MMFNRLLIASLIISTSTIASELTDEAINRAMPDGIEFPSDERIAEEGEKKKELIDRAMKAKPVQGTKLEVNPATVVIDVESRKPVHSTNTLNSIERARGPIRNIMDLATRNQNNNPTNPFDQMPAGDTEEALLFLSTSIPDQKLKLLIEQAATAKVRVVFRGTPSGDLNYRTLQAHISKLKPRSSPIVDIDPTAFTRYAVTRVPTFAVGKFGKVPGFDENGCLPDTSFVKISGDISVVYAFKEIAKEASPELKRIADRHIY